MSRPPAPTPYPGYDVLAKWDSPSYNAQTRAVLARRLHGAPAPRVFDADEFALLEAICARLLPQPDRAEPIPIAPWIDADLHDGHGEGFRAPDMPGERQAWRKLLAGIDAEARRRWDRPFAALHADQQDAVLDAVQKGEVEAEAWKGLPAAHAFSEVLLKTAVGIYYSHPQAWSEIGFGGPASPRGYVRLGLDERDPWEPPLAPAPGDGL